MSITPFTRLIGDYIEKRELTLEGFASAMNMRSVWLARLLLDGSALPQLATLPKLAAALQVDPVALSLAWVASSQPAFADAIAQAAHRLAPIAPDA